MKGVYKKREEKGRKEKRRVRRRLEGRIELLNDQERRKEDS